MCLLLKLDYAKFGVSNLFFQKLSKKTFGGRPPAVVSIYGKKNNNKKTQKKLNFQVISVSDPRISRFKFIHNSCI